MKVKELYIKDYHQFEDFRLDLTYPEGHKKAGQPLDKVCFIGQSGTGKTSLLEVIRKSVLKHFDYQSDNFERITEVAPNIFDDILSNNPIEDFTGRILFTDNIDFEYDNHDDIYVKETINYLDFDSTIKIEIGSNIGFQYEDITYSHLLDDYIKYINKLSPAIISAPADINFKGFHELSKESISIKLLREIDISKLKFDALWKAIEKELIRYREGEIKQRVVMSERIQSSLSNKEEVFKAVEEFEKWQAQTTNPIIGLSILLDKILNRFNLRVRTKLDFQKTEDISSIKVETLQGDEVVNAFLSTGTKQVIFTALPLYSSKPLNTVILFDEPERSLYPDIQREIVDIYTSLTTDCQFFYATHSPIIASSFEPWEIVELKFNSKTGKVYQELYYEGERHVDNYTINPQYLRWDDILGRLFDLEDEGNPKRTQALMRLAILESKLKKNNITLEEKKTLWEEYAKLSKLTGWTTRMTHEKN